VIANDLAERHCHVEISRAPDVENDWGLAIAEVLQKSKQPLERIPLDDAFSRDPFGTVRPAAPVPAVRQIENHGAGRRSDAASRRACRILGPGGGYEHRRGDDEGSEHT
jgi:hypothetical protein